MLYMLVGSVGFLTSCKKDDDDDGTDKYPTMNFVGGAGYVDSNVQLTVGDAFKVGVSAASNATTSTKLVSFKVTRTANNNPVTVLDSTLNAKSMSTWTYNFTAQSSVGTESFKFTITDADGESASLSFTVETVASGAIDTHTGLQAGAQSNTTLGSFIGLSNGTIYKSADAPANSASVDAVYYVPTGGTPSFGAPDDTEADGVFNTLPFTGGTTNGTRFVNLSSSMTATQFDAITDDTAILSNVGTPTSTKVSSLAVIRPPHTAGSWRPSLCALRRLQRGSADRKIWTAACDATGRALSSGLEHLGAHTGEGTSAIGTADVPADCEPGAKDGEGHGENSTDQQRLRKRHVRIVLQ